MTATDVAGPVSLGESHGLRRRGLLVFVALALGVAAGQVITYDRNSDARASSESRAESPSARVERLEQAARREPRDLATLQALGAAYVQAVAAGGDVALFNDAEAVLDRAEEIAPGDSDTLIRQGFLALARHDFNRAQRLAAQAIAADPFDADALAVVVDAEVELGRYDEAAAHLQQLLDLRPGVAAYSRVSYLRELHGDIAGARTAFAQAEAAGSDRFDLATVAVLRGKLALDHGALDEAAVDFTRARGYLEDVAGLEAGEARLLAVRGDRAGAIDVLEVAIEERPTAEVAILLGDLLRLDGRVAAAQRADEVVRELARDERAAGADVNMELALFEADRGYASRALELAELAYAAKPDSITANIAMAWALRAGGRAPEALPYVDRALRLGTLNGLLRYRAAAILADAGETERAAAELQVAFTVNPVFSVGHLEEARRLAERLGVMVPRL